MIEANALHKRYGRLLAVDDISFKVEPGEVLGFLGPNGAGKSTTMKMIAGFLAPSAGTARVCGHDVQREPLAARRALGYLPEGAPAYGEMEPAAFLRFVGQVRGLRGEVLKSRLDAVISRLALGGVLRQPVDTLSKGFKRRVGLAAAILHDPPALILDEPTDGLDPNQKHEVRTLIRELARERTVLLSTHILEEVEAVCTRAMIVARGKVLADAAPAELLARSRYQGAVSLQVEDSIAARAALEGMPGSSGLHHDGGDGRLYVFPQGGKPVSAEAVAERLRQRGVAFSGLQTERGRLDEVFRRITTGEGAA
ncbi:ABC transporter ATP-binding protein [Arenimonas fontis]|uniref:ATP-binding cassette domain-containing protein n=1 Tax=Arenimonas fontis TaxID=2608255 RepID=A0A5B2ZDM8_9GAMM|nr:ATP-binding cassette domain-containing protein [Arenimonas fontis]KAA2286226.1 ATP-binding cassette domain-containing protein [Arenimonas fontis]